MLVHLQVEHEAQAPQCCSGERPTVLYGAPTDDSMGEVRFSVELTQLVGLKGTYSLDIRRLRGNLKSYSFIYNTIRECVLSVSTSTQEMATITDLYAGGQSLTINCPDKYAVHYTLTTLKFALFHV